MTEHVSFQAKNGKPASGEIAAPKAGGKAPGVVVIQEWWGVDDHIKSIVDRLAVEGFLALAPDLYHGVVVKRPDAESAEKHMSALDWGLAMQEVGGAIDYLQKDARGTGKVAIIGFCMGGAVTLRAATMFSSLAAAVPFYGIADDADYSKVRVPIQGHFGSRDQWASVAKARAIKDKVVSAGGSMELEVYDADHAFFNDKRPEVYDAKSAELAWKRAVDFIRKHTG